MTRNVKKHRYVTKEGLKAYNDKFEAWTRKDSATFAGTAGDAEKLGGESPEHYATAQSVTDEVNRAKNAEKALQNDINDVRNTTGTAEANYDATKRQFVVSGMNFTQGSLGRTRFVIKMNQKVTEMGENDKVRLSIGGFVLPISWFGSTPTPTRCWKEGDFVDVWYHDMMWHVTPAEGSRISYEKWGECIRIEKPY